MTLGNIEERLSQIDPSQRVLLLSHCLRPSQTCPGKFEKKGLVCPEDCSEDCALRRFREVASRLGYKGSCIAAGGAMALRFVREHSPQGIVAVGCERELVEGVQGVKQMVADKQQVPAIMVIPLARDGCVDTQVDEDQVLKAIALGASSKSSAELLSVPNAGDGQDHG